MKDFAELLERLLFAPGRNTKISLLRAYFTTRPDPERGYALAAIAGALDFPGAKAATLRALAVSRLDSELFDLSYDFVGDLAETIALIWPTRGDAPPALSEVVDTLARCQAHGHSRADRGMAGPVRSLHPPGFDQAAHWRLAGRRLLAPCQARPGGDGPRGCERDRGNLARAGTALHGPVRLGGRPGRTAHAG